MFTYTWYQWLAFFYLYCFCGWIFESAYVSIRTRKPVNRGFLRLPMLPIYGSGAVMMLFVSSPFRENLALTWLSGVIGATALEYVTGYVMEQLFKVRYWDYSNQRFNLNGYICLSSSIAWGFLTIFMTHLIHKPIEQAVLSLAPMTTVTVDGVVSVLFVCDTVVCTREALAFGKALQALRTVRSKIDELPVQAKLLRMETGDRLQAAKERVYTRVERHLPDMPQLPGRPELPGISDLPRLSGLPGFRSLPKLSELPTVSELPKLSELPSITELPSELVSKYGRQIREFRELLMEHESWLSVFRSLHGRFGKNLFRSNPSIRSRLFDHEFELIRKYFEDGGEGQSPQ